jgi:hypothetical protein
MQYVNSYYDITARLRYYGRIPESTRIDGCHVRGELGTNIADVERWKDPPHEALANVRRVGEWNLCDPKAVEAFVKRYGVLDPWLDNWSPSSSSKFDEDCVRFGGFQETLCKAWRRDTEALSVIAVQVVDALDARTSMNAGSIDLTTENLWSFISVLFMRDFQLAKARVCASSDCIHPYFVVQRRGQKYCSHICAVRENVRRFRQADVHAKQQRIISKGGRRSKEHGVIKTR